MTRWPWARRNRAALLAAGSAVVVATAGLAAWSARPSGTTTISVHVTGPGPSYHALIRRTGYGIPHILAASLGGAGFGQGWAYAQDRFCDLDEQVVRVRSQLARWLGPGPGDLYLGSDLAFLGLRLMALARAQLPTLAPDVRSLLDGYAAGFDGYLRTTGAAHISGWCAGAPWITSVTPTDLLAYQRELAIHDSGMGFLRGIVTAQPPGGTQASAGAARAPAALMQAVAGVPDPGAHTGLGSNGWALGGARSANGRGILVANPHFPWQGPLALWECQLTVPGVLNVYGASLGGMPGVQIGFNDHLAWTHTVSASAQFTLYSVRLVPGHPTEYLFDGKPTAMRAVPASVEVQQADGKLAPFRRTVWYTRYGPVVNDPPAGRQAAWTASRAITYADAGIGDGNLLAQWLHMDEAASLRQFQQVFRQYQAMPWLNTVAVDDRGNAWYIDDSAVPNLSPAAARAWVRAPGQLLNGSSSRFAWVRVPGARSPGLVPYPDQPQLERRDYVFNANNSYWLANPSHPLTGFSPLYGQAGTVQGPRTRENAVVLAGMRHVTVSQAGQAILSERSLTSDLLASGVIRACQARGSRPVRVAGTPVSLAAACRALQAWNRRFTVSARGAALWREFVFDLLDDHPAALTQAGPLFQRGFDPRFPVTTPAGLARDTGPVLQALARAVLSLRRAKIAPDAPLGSVQYTWKGGSRIPVPGSADDTGILNVADYLFPSLTLELPPPDGQAVPGSDDLTTAGYVVNDGTSFLLTVGFTAHGPAARAILTFSESGDPASPHYADQTRLLRAGRLLPVLFSGQAIESDRALRTEAVSEGG